MARQIGYGALTITDVTDGVNNATIYLYHWFQSQTGHILPANNALTYHFSTGRLTGEAADFNGWRQDIPPTPPSPVESEIEWFLYVITATATSVEDEYIIPSWSNEVRLNGANGADGNDGVSITAVRELYWFKVSTSPRQINWVIQPSQSGGYEGVPSETIYEDTAVDHWTSQVPAYQAGGYYYTCIESTFDDGNKYYSTPELNQALTDANNNALVARSIAEANEENAQGAMAISQGLESRLRYIWVNLNEPSGTISDDTNTTAYLGGTYAASGINGTAFSTSNPSTYGWNSLLRHNKMMFRYNGIALTTLGIDGLKLYAPITSNGVVTGHQLSVEITGGTQGVLNFYNPKTGKVGLSLNKDNITFYKHDSTTAAATLNGTGLNIAAGSIKLGDYFEATSDGTITAKKGTIGSWNIDSNSLYTGTWGTDNSAMLCTGTIGSKAVGGSNSISGWVFTAGANFGVTKSGVLYAIGANIKGAITATSLKIGNNTTSITTDAILNTNVQTQNFSEGTMLYKDPTFASGVNSTNRYANSGTSYVTWTRSAKSSDNPMTGTSYEMVCKNTGAASPGLGGFYWGHSSRANAIFLYRIIAKIPTGHNIQFASNGTGDNPTRVWLTPNVGTSQFKEYVFKQVCGSSGSFSSTGFFYIDGTAGTSSAPVTWYVAYAAVFDMTGVAEVKNYVTSIDSNGIWVTPSGKKPTNTSTGAGATGTKIDDSGVGIYVGGTKLAQYGTTTYFYEPDGTTAATLDGTGLNIKTGTITLGSTFSVTAAGALTATGATINGAITATSFTAQDLSGSTRRTRVVVDTNGLTVYDGSGTASANIQARFGTTVQVGKQGAGYITIASTGMDIYVGSSSAHIASFGSNIRMGKDSAYNAYIDSDSIKLRNGSVVNGRFRQIASGSRTKVKYPHEILSSGQSYTLSALSSATGSIIVQLTCVNSSGGRRNTTVTFTKGSSGTRPSNPAGLTYNGTTTFTNGSSSGYTQIMIVGIRYTVTSVGSQLVIGNTTSYSSSPLVIGESGSDPLLNVDNGGNMEIAGNLSAWNVGNTNISGNSGQIVSGVSVSSGTSKAVDSFVLSKGVWIIAWTMKFSKNATGIRYGSVSQTSGSTWAYAKNKAISADEITVLNATQIVAPTADGTTYYLSAYQNSGSTLTVSAEIFMVQIA